MDFAPYEDYFISVDDIVVNTTRTKTKLVLRLSTGNKITSSANNKYYFEPDFDTTVTYDELLSFIEDELAKKYFRIKQNSLKTEILPLLVRMQPPAIAEVASGQSISQKLLSKVSCNNDLLTPLNDNSDLAIALNRNSIKLFLPQISRAKSTQGKQSATKAKITAKEIDLVVLDVVVEVQSLPKRGHER